MVDYDDMQQEITEKEAILSIIESRTAIITDKIINKKKKHDDNDSREYWEAVTNGYL